MIIISFFQLLKNTKTLKTDKSIDSEKVSSLEIELKEALNKIKELESSKEKDDKPAEKKVRFGDMSRRDSSDSIKSKQDELDKLKLNYNKVYISI